MKSAFVVIFVHSQIDLCQVNAVLRNYLSKYTSKIYRSPIYIIDEQESARDIINDSSKTSQTGRLAAYAAEGCDARKARVLGSHNYRSEGI